MEPLKIAKFEDAYLEAYNQLLEKDVSTMTEILEKKCFIEGTIHTPFSIYKYLGLMIHLAETGQLYSSGIYRASCNLLIYLRSDTIAFDKFSRMSLPNLCRFIVKAAVLNLGGAQFETFLRDELKRSAEEQLRSPSDPDKIE